MKLSRVLLLVTIVACVCMGAACAKSPKEAAECFEWNPYIWGDALTKAYGESAKETTFNCISAILDGEDTFIYVDEEDVTKFAEIATVVCPYVEKIADLDFENGNGIATIQYLCSVDEAKDIIDKYAEAVESVLNESVEKGDSDETKAIMIHYDYSRSVDYDYAIFEYDNVSNIDLSENLDVGAYRAMVEKKGICQSFAMALAHLYLQAGLDPNLALGSSPEYPHIWVYMELNGEKIFIDPTWEDTHGGTGLSYFGTDTAFYNEHEYTVFDDLVMTDENYDGNISSEKYKPLWKMQKINSIKRKRGKLIIDYIDESGSAATFEVNN